MNKIFLIGRLTKDPQMGQTQSGKTVARFSVAVKKQGQGDGADFFDATAFDKTAENVLQYLAKGRQVAVVGRVSIGSYTDRNGVTRKTFDILADQVEFIGGNGNQAAENTAPKNSDVDTLREIEDDDDMPF